MSQRRRSIKFYKIHSYYRCHDCKAFSLFPKLEDGEIENLYSASYIEDVNPEFNLNEQVVFNRFLKLQETLQEYNTQGSREFLDYGCGANAEVLLLASDLGYKANGVEVEATTREKAALKSGCPVLSPEELLTSGKEFDFIFLGDVLEHLCDPLDVLSRMESALSSKGLLIIQGPLEGSLTISNTLLSIKAKLLSKKPSEFPPYHVSLATRKSIVRALKINGLSLQKFIVNEPLWPASRFGTKSSIVSFSAFAFSFTKLIDMILSKIITNYGTRFYLLASKSDGQK